MESKILYTGINISRTMSLARKVHSVGLRLMTLDLMPLGEESAQTKLLGELRGACNKLQKVQHSIWKLRGVAHRAKDKDPNQPFRKHVHEEYSAAMASLRNLVETTERMSRGEYCSDSGLDYTLSDAMANLARHILAREEFDEIRKTPHSVPMERRRLPETEQMWTLFLYKKQVLLKDLAELESLVGSFKRVVVAKVDAIELTMYASS